MLPLSATDTSFIDYASRGSVIALLVIILYGGFKKEPWWVFGWVYKEVVERFDKLESAYDNLQQITIRSANAAQTLAEHEKKPEEPAKLK